MSPVNTGILFLQFTSVINPKLLTKIISAAVQKAEKCLYIKVKGLPLTESKISTYNRIVNQIYHVSSRSALDRFDTRVVLTDFRDSLMSLKDDSSNKLQTSYTIETVITVKQEKTYTEEILNKLNGITNEVLQIDSNSNDSETLLNLEPQQEKNMNFPHIADENSMYDHVVIGGTFDNLHSGHKMLISAAILRCKKSLTIGVTDSNMIKSKKLWELIEPCQTRIKKLEGYLMDVEPRLEYRVVPITDLYGPTKDDPNLQLLVVSEETQRGGLKINELRQGKGWNLLDIHTISLIDDHHAGVQEETKISSSSFRKRLLGSHIKPPKLNTKPYVIGLTGGIASGKSTIAKRLKDLGAHTISCDQLGHLAYKKGTECFRQMVEYFGNSILNEENEIDRKKLGPLVFSNKDHLKRLNMMVWPEIRRLYTKEINELREQNFQGAVVLDAAILLEAGWQEDCAEIWVAIIPKEEAINRIVERDRITIEQATSRVESQLSNSDRVASANVVICSSWEPAVTAAQVLKAWKFVQEFLKRKCLGNLNLQLTGGTFTDVYAVCPDGKERVTKLLSVDPSNYPDAPREGIRRILEEELGIQMPASQPVDTSMIEWIRMGTTVATNALLERKGERMALVITNGFSDLLYIGNQARPNIFDLKIGMPQGLYETVIEAKERVILDHPTCQLTGKGRQVVATNGEKLWVIDELNQEHLKNELKKIREIGILSIAIVLMHSYIYPVHEEIIEKIARSVGIQSVSLSSKIMPMMRIVPRGFTAASDAYLTPHIQRYLQGFCSGFKNQLEGVNVLFMQSDGGLTPMDTFSGSRAILSGPAGGVVGYARTLYGSVSNDLPVIGFDMGGTSTDVSRYDGALEHVFETTTAGITIQAPQLDVNTVAAGGGSMLFFRDGMFVVGPESAGAHPGPACYKKGGPLTVTDANLRLGRLIPEHFPKIFGKHENEPLDSVATTKAFQQLTRQVNERFDMSEEEVAMGFINVANEAMCRPIRALTQARGHDTSRHVLACFGGAGGQHACAIARSLGMKVVLIHRYSGILSAYGMALADVVHEEQEVCSKPYKIDNFEYIDQRIAQLAERCRDSLLERGFPPDQIHTKPYLHMRYDRTDCALLCEPADCVSGLHQTSLHGDFMKSFVEKYKTEFGFSIDGRLVIVDDIRVRGIAKTGIQTVKTLAAASLPATAIATSPIYFEGGYRECEVFLLKDILPGHSIPGPAMIIDQLGTIIVEPSTTAELTNQGDLRITIHDAPTTKISLELCSVQLSIFSHRFMSIAEQMGRILQRTAVSTNIKERLDFSCALFGPDGGLVSNAPHIPVHLGAMQEAVQYQLHARGSDILPGDVFLSNHPSAGGSHLPDLTVITPVFWENQPKPVFYVASRGHHADIGGITPGSMPPHSHTLNEEGAVFKSFVLVRNGEFKEAELVDALNAPGKVDIPGASGTRNLHDNLSDLRAQVAANQKGIGLVSELMAYYGIEVVQQYMSYVRHNAENAVRILLKEVAKKSGHWLKADDFMDDGTKISLSVTIDPNQGSATFDFTGTGCQVWGNTNAPRAVSLSAIIYCLRSLVGHDIPLNQGCLVPVQVIIPEGCLLNPYPEAGVVGGNVLTSQRVVDVVLKAFGACAASQGCMNNITFGDETMGYYETVAGGSGAGHDWNGRSGIHSHMTNTRITDAEVLERRYPVILRSFSLRQGSGGLGQYRGGDGISRELLFRKTMTLSVLTERRVFAPYGLEGGEEGAKGSNSLLRQDGVLLNLGAKCSVDVHAGDSFKLLTPGGGGFGRRNEDENKLNLPSATIKFTERGSVYEFRSLQESA